MLSTTTNTSSISIANQLPDMRAEKSAILAAVAAGANDFEVKDLHM
jgi:hypothetical protein